MAGFIDCCGLVKSCLIQFNLMEEIIEEDEAAKRIQIESEKWQDIDRNDLWGGLTKKPFPLCDNLKSSLSRFYKERIETGTAVDLGCGNCESTTYLLQMGWKVIAVDSSEIALENLQQRANRLDPTWIQNKHLTLVCQDMETYRFPRNTQLVLAQNSLMCCNPEKIGDLFKKIYASLAVGGRLIGNFYLPPKDQMIEGLHRKFFGTWFANKPVVNFLLDNTGFQKEFCAYANYTLLEGPQSIEFVARKT
jgi:SAM-dependent methyltransferase